MPTAAAAAVRARAGCYTANSRDLGLGPQFHQPSTLPMMTLLITGRWAAIRAVLMLAATVLAGFPANAASVISLGPHGVQSLIVNQLFTRQGKWYLIDDGQVCYTYLEAPHTKLDADRLVLTAHLISRLGQRVGDSCLGAELASTVTLSGKLLAADHQLILDDIRIDRVDDESTRTALSLAQQLAPQAMPRSAHIDVLDLLRRAISAGSTLPLRVDQFHIVSLVTKPEGITLQVDLSVSTP